MKGSIGLKTLITIASSLVFMTSCRFFSQPTLPDLRYCIDKGYITSLPSAFLPLSDDEKQTLWGIEYQIGKGFANKLDLYRAITAFQRSSLLAPENHCRRLETDYQILLSYYLGKRYQEIDRFLCTSPLMQADETFPAFDDLLIILFDVQWHLNEEEKACQLLELIGKRDPKTYRALLTGSLMQKADFTRLKTMGIKEMQTYQAMAKSPLKAAFFSALLPGAGYLYIGQIQTAITGLLLNFLFIATTITFFRRRLIALGLLFLSFEIGWYGGGVYGAFSQATYYNQRIFEKIVTPIMNRDGYFPIHRLRYGF